MVVPPYSLKGLLESRLVQFAIRSRGLGIVSIICCYRSGYLFLNKFFDDFDDFGSYGLERCSRWGKGEFLRVPPLLL